MSKDKGGRPLKFSSPKQLQSSINKYFKYCDENNRPYTIAGMAEHLGVDRQTIYNYEQRDEFFGTIKKARLKIERYIEEILILEGKAGQIFYAKNYGYKDQQDINTKVTINKGLEDFFGDD